MLSREALVVLSLLMSLWNACFCAGQHFQQEERRAPPRVFSLTVVAKVPGSWKQTASPPQSEQSLGSRCETRGRVWALRRATRSCWWFASGAQTGLLSQHCTHHLWQWKKYIVTTPVGGEWGYKWKEEKGLLSSPAWHPYMYTLWPSYLHRHLITLFMKSDSAMSMDGFTSTCRRRWMRWTPADNAIHWFTATPLHPHPQPHRPQSARCSCTLHHCDKLFFLGKSEHLSPSCFSLQPGCISSRRALTRGVLRLHTVKRFYSYI